MQVVIISIILQIRLCEEILHTSAASALFLLTLYWFCRASLARFRASSRIRFWAMASRISSLFIMTVTENGRDILRGAGGGCCCECHSREHEPQQQHSEPSLPYMFHIHHLQKCENPAQYMMSQNGIPIARYFQFCVNSSCSE